MATNFLSLRSVANYNSGGSTISDGAIQITSTNQPYWTNTLMKPINFSTLTGSTITTGALSVQSSKVAIGQSTTQTAGANVSNGSYSNWITAKSGLTNIRKIAISATGQYQLIVASGALWFSSDSGQSWSQPTAYGLPSSANYTYTSGAISADGMYITIGVQGDLLYVSSDSGATFNNPQPGVSPYSWLRFENNFTDSGTGSATITPTTSPNAPTFSSTIVPSSGSGYSMRLTNTAGGTAAQYVRGTWSGATNFTVSMWVNFQSVGAQQNFFGAYTNSGFVIYLKSTNYLSLFVGNTDVVTTTFTVSTNNWYYITATFVANGIGSFYVNNTLIGTYACGSTPGTSSGSFGLGTMDVLTTLAFNGYIDDFRLTNSAITYQAVNLSPYAWLKCDNSTADTMGNTVTSGTITYIPGRIGSSAAVLANTAGSTANNFLRVAYPSGNTITLSFWFNIQTAPTGGYFSAVCRAEGIAINIATGLTLGIALSGSSGWVTFIADSATNTQIILNTWYHLYVTIQSPGQCTAYLDGRSLGTYTFGGFGVTNSTITFGTLNSGNSYGFNGYVDDVRIYNTIVPYGIVPANWTQLAVSGTGQYQLAGTESGMVYQSSDYGKLWSLATTATSAGLVKSLSLSHTGQYQVVNAQKWVTPNMSGLAAATWTQGGVTWTASASSVASTNYAYNLFNTTTNTTYGSVGNYSTSGVYNNTYSTTILGGVGSKSGEWIQLQTSVPLVLSSYCFTSGGGIWNFPKSYYIVGSNDGTNWYPIQYISDMTANPFTATYTTGANNIPVASGSILFTGNTASTLTSITYAYSSMPYTYFRIIATAVWGVGSPGNAGFELGELNMNFLAGNVYSPQQTGLDSNTWSVNGITYTASASSIINSAYQPHRAFNIAYNTAPTSWASETYKYDSSTNAYIGTNSTIIQTIGTILGDYLQIQTSVPLVLSSYTYAACYDQTQLGRNYYIVGSTNGTTWYPIQYCTGTTNPFTTQYSSSSTYLLANYNGTQTIYGNRAVTVTTTSYSTSGAAYTYFRFVYTHVYTPAQLVEIGELYLNFFGGQSYSTDYGTTWSMVPSTYISSGASLSGSGQYSVGLNNNPIIARMTYDANYNDGVGTLAAPTVTGSIPLSTAVYKVGTASAYFANTAGGTPSGGYLNYTLPSSLYLPSTITVSLWIYPTAYGGTTTPLAFTNGSTTFGPYIYFRSSGIGITINATTGGTTQYAEYSTAPALNTWTHVAATFYAGTMILYINGAGVAVTSTGFSGLGLSTGGNLTNLYIGTLIPSNYSFAGYIDDVRLYPYALSADQVYDLYRSPATQCLSITSNYLTNLSSTPSLAYFLAGNSAPLVDSASSYNGQYMVIINSATSGNNVWYSTNYGAAWTSMAITLNPADTPLSPLRSCAISYDGSYVTLASATTTYTLNNNGSGYTLAIGSQAGAVAQGANSIAIGTKAGLVNQTASSIVLNASGSTVNAAQSGFYVAPVQNVASAATSSLNILGYGDDSQVVKSGIIVRNGASGQPYVGIGITNPLTTIHVSGTVTANTFTAPGGNWLTIANGAGLGQVNLRGGSILLSNGWVGIGTDSPTSILHIRGSGGGGVLRLVNSTDDLETGIAYYGKADMSGTNLWVHGINSWQVGATNWAIGNLNIASAALTILSGGNVGIGITTPRDILHISHVSSGNLRLQATTGITSSSEITFDNALSGMWHQSGYGNNPTTSARGAAYAAGMIRCNNESGNNYENSYMSFWTCRDPQSDGVGGLGVLYERMRINSLGYVGIGTATPGYTLHVQGAIYASGEITGLSDQRFKTKVVPLEQSLEKVSQLQGVSYYRTDEEPDKKRIGLLAQAVAGVYPEAVSYDDTNDRYSLNYMALVAPLIEAVKELRVLVKTQAQEIVELKDQIRERL